MLNQEWEQVAGFSNMGENDESIFAKRVGEEVSVAYMAYGGVKVVELAGNFEVSQFDNNESDFSIIISECGDDWELAIPIVIDGVKVIAVVDDNSNVSLIASGDDVSIDTNKITVESSEEFDAEELDNLEGQLLECFHLL